MLNARVLAPMRNGGCILEDTPPYEVDTTTTSGTTYKRFENEDARTIYIERWNGTKNECTQALWEDRVTATYVPKTV